MTSGATAALTQDLLRTDQFYAPNANDFRAVMLNQAAVSAAAAKAAAQASLNSSTQRLTYLNTLRNSLGSTTDVKAATDANARLAGEQATAQAQTNQLLALLLLQNAQAATTDGSGTADVALLSRSFGGGSEGCGRGRRKRHGDADQRRRPGDELWDHAISLGHHHDCFRRVEQPRSVDRRGWRGEFGVQRRRGAGTRC